MKFARLGAIGSEAPVVITGDDWFDVRPVAPDINGAFFENNGITRVRDALEAGKLPPIKRGEGRIGSPVDRPGKIVCVGLNYSDHAAEAGLESPSEPILFLKASSTVSGPFDDVYIPRGSVKTDWEIELGIVVGRRARYLSSMDDPLEYIAGYCVSHDVSEREFQLERGGQWDKGKSCERFNPLGPYLVTTDEVHDPQDLTLHLTLNDEVRQHGSTDRMIFSVADLLRYISQFMVLEPGDLINTGTPAGVGMGRDPEQFLASDDVVSLTIEGLGTQRQRFVPAP